jgi:hypothetical protein
MATNNNCHQQLGFRWACKANNESRVEQPVPILSEKPIPFNPSMGFSSLQLIFNNIACF